MKDKILLFIPMYNCAPQIVRVLNQLSDEVCSSFAEIIIVNNRSTDDGENAVRTYLKDHTIPIPVRLLRNNDNYGLGGSHKVAFRYAVSHGFDYVVVFHGDDQGEIRDILPFLKRRIYRKYDCLLGARFMKGSRLKGYSLFRTVGNVVYNILFSIVCGFPVYDLGSGLNMYSSEILKDQFYLKYKDNLVFNYMMIMGAGYYKHKVCFFPITWKEEDQVSNVKMASQAFTVLKLLALFAFDKSGFMAAEHRDKITDEYSYEEIFTN